MFGRACKLDITRPDRIVTVLQDRHYWELRQNETKHGWQRMKLYQGWAWIKSLSMKESKLGKQVSKGWSTWRVFPSYSKKICVTCLSAEPIKVTSLAVHLSWDKTWSLFGQYSLAYVVICKYILSMWWPHLDAKHPASRKDSVSLWWAPEQDRVSFG